MSLPARLTLGCYRSLVKPEALRCVNRVRARDLGVTISRGREDRRPADPIQNNPASLTRHPFPIYSQVAVTTPDPTFVKVDGCDLCRAARITPWYHEDDICWVAECDVCDVPMVVWRFHGTEPPTEHLTHMHERLREIATRQLGEIYVDDHMRNIPDHYHAHGRPKGGFFGHGLRRPAS